METFPGNQLLPVSSQVATVIWKKSERDRGKEKLLRANMVTLSVNSLIWGKTKMWMEWERIIEIE